MTAEIGLMKATEQLSAMEMMAVDPLARVVAPRFWGGVISMPLLAALFSTLGIFGAYLVGVKLIGIDNGAFWGNMQAAVDFRRDIVNGIIKSVVFGIVVSLIAVFEGYDAQPTAEGVSTATTRTVVGSSLAILAARLRPHRASCSAASAVYARRLHRYGNFDEPRDHRPVGRHLRHDRHRRARSSSSLKVGNLLTTPTTPGYRLEARFDNIGGLKLRAPVKAAGVVVGRVESIQLDPKTYEARGHAARSTTATSSADGHDRVDPHVGAARRGVRRPRRRRRHADARRRRRDHQDAVGASCSRS